MLMQLFGKELLSVNKKDSLAEIKTPTTFKSQISKRFNKKFY